MARDGSGNYTLPAGNPVITGTAIDSSDFNDTMNDLAAEMTDSLSRSGSGSMTAGLPGFAGTVSLPGFAFSGDLNTGIYWVSADLFGVSIGGVNTLRFGPNGTQAANGTVSLPSYSFLNDLDCGQYRIGANNIGYAIGGTKVLDIQGAATGGLFVNNTLTGAGSERVLTTSDVSTVIIKYKTASQAKTTDITLADDTHLVFTALPANTEYIIDGYLEINNPTTELFKYNLNVDNAVQFGVWNLIMSPLSANDKVQTDVKNINGAVGQFSAEAGTAAVVHLNGFIHTHLTLTTDLALQWAQVVSGGGSTSINQGSFIRLTKVS